MNLDFLKGKSIAIVGKGVNNSALATYFDKHNIPYASVPDWKDVSQLLGRLDSFDIIFRTPGLPFLSKPIQDARAKGVEISSQTKLFFDLCPAKIIVITGTKGKGTASSLIFEILKAAGKRVWLAGNIGKDPFEFLDKLTASDLAILELSSFQLQDLEKSPHIAVVLAVTPDHLNHHRNFEEYIQAKSSILAYQQTNDFAVIYPSLPDWFKDLGKGKKILIKPDQVKGFARKLMGEHNLDNIAAASAVAEILSIDENVVKATVANFEPLPHRLRFIREVNGIKFIDDAFSTNIDPAIAAIDAVKSPLILIVGGFDKGLNLKPLGAKILSTPRIKGLVIIGDVTEKILQVTKGFGGKILTGAKNMRQIIDQALALAERGDTILFSPATSSFDMFKNETDRGEQFVKMVQNV